MAAVFTGYGYRSRYFVAHIIDFMIFLFCDYHQNSAEPESGITLLLNKKYLLEFKDKRCVHRGRIIKILMVSLVSEE